VYNNALAARKASYEAGDGWIPSGLLSRRLITEAKGNPGTAFLGEVSAVVLQQALRDDDVAFKNFFDSATGRRKGKRVGESRFRSRRDNRQAIRFTANARFKVADAGRLSLPKIGEVKVRWSRDLPSEPSSVTVVKDASGRYFASFVVATDEADDLSRFPAADEYAETGIDLGRWAPTSQVCSTCGVKDGPKPLHVRRWRCAGCGTVHDRDVNAAVNVRNLGRLVAAGRAETPNARGGEVRPPSAVAPADEAGTRRGDRTLTGVAR